MSIHVCVACSNDLKEQETTYNATMDGYLCNECAGVTVSAVTCDRCGGDVPEAAACWEMATPVCPPCFLAGTDTDPAGARFRAEYWAAWHSRDVEQHAVDGFTLWWTDSAGVFRHRRFIGYTVSEAVELAARHVAGGGQ